MYERVKEPNDYKSRAVADSVVQRKGNVRQGFGFADNRPEAVAQRKLMQLINHKPFQRKGLKYTNTVMKHNVIPKVNQLAAKKKKSVEDRVKLSREKDRKLVHKRSATAFGALAIKTRGRQGPHRISHITTCVMLDAVTRHGGKPTDLLGTRIIPRPEVNNQHLFLIFKSVSLSSKRKQALAKYQCKYRKLYILAKLGNQGAAEKLIEYNAMQTYKLATGIATTLEMMGKGERRSVAADDIVKVTRWTKTSFNIKEVSTLDATGLVAWQERQQALRLRQFASAVNGDDLSDGGSIGSRDDDELEK